MMLVYAHGADCGDPSNARLIVIIPADGQHLWPIHVSFLRSITFHLHVLLDVSGTIGIERQGWPLPPARKLTRKIQITGILHNISVAQTGYDHSVMATADRRLMIKGQEHLFYYLVVLIANMQWHKNDGSDAMRSLRYSCKCVIGIKCNTYPFLKSESPTRHPEEGVATVTRLAPGPWRCRRRPIHESGIRVNGSFIGRRLNGSQHGGCPSHKYGCAAVRAHIGQKSGVFGMRKLIAAFQDECKYLTVGDRSLRRGERLRIPPCLR